MSEAPTVPEADRFPPGTRVKVREDATETGDGDRGTEYLIGEYVPAEEDADREGGWWPPAYDVQTLPGASNAMFGGMIPHAALVQTMTAAEHDAAFRLPTPEELVEFLSSAIIGGWETEAIENVNETERETSMPVKGEPTFEGAYHPFKHGVTFYGRGPGGRTFGATVRITGLWETDG